MKTKNLFILLTLLLSMVGLKASAYDIAVENGDGVMIYYSYSNENELSVTYASDDYNSYSGAVVIPEEVTYKDKTLKVTNIGLYAFYGCSGLTSIEIPNSVTLIENHAFDGCTNLQKVIVRDIAAWCKTIIMDEDNPLAYAHHIYSDENTEITDLVIPDGVTHIGHYAFYNCSGLTSVTIPNSVKSIKNASFWGCSGLTSIEIPNSVTSIEEYAFANCFGLTFVEIPNSVTSISYDAFAGCSNLTSVKINSSSIGAWFRGNNFINNIIFGENVTSIGNYAFYGCAGLTSLIIPNSVTSIGQSAFQFCTGLTSLTIPNNVVSIGDDAFNACTGLSSISVEQGNSVYDSRNNCNAIIETSSNILLVGCKTTVIPNGVTSIGNGVFVNCDDITSIEIPNSVTSIGNQAFTYCHDLTSITIPNSVTSIGETAFGGCTSLTSVVIPNSVTSIGNSAFYGCSDLTSVNIPNNLTSIGDRVFLNCSSLTSVEIPNSVTSIGGYAFFGCSSLTSIEIPKSVTNIGSYAFFGCSSLTSVTMLRDNPVSISSDVFPNRANATLYVPVGSKTAYEAADYWKEFKEIVEIETTGIQTVENAQTAEGLETGNWFTLDGRLLNGKPTQKGIYIVNGYKVVIK